MLLKKGEKINLYCAKSTNDKYSYEILEIKTSKEYILVFNDSIESLNKNNILGCYFSPIIILLAIILEVIYIKFLISMNKTEKELKEIVNKIKL